jgi:predicted  nucleic acid-binding Zn-ribbon protein
MLLLGILGAVAFASEEKMKLAQVGPPGVARQNALQPEIEQLQTRIRELEEQLRNISQYEKSLTEQAIVREEAAVHERDAARRELQALKEGGAQLPGVQDARSKERFEETRGMLERALADLNRTVGDMKSR